MNKLNRINANKVIIYIINDAVEYYHQIHLFVMRKSFLLLVALCAVWSSEAMAQTVKQYLFVTTVESIIPGGIGRSRMMVTQPNGEQSEEDLRNFYSLVGINFGNIKDNDEDILQKINTLVSEGWTLEFVNAGVQSPSDTQSQGIYMTRYLFSRSK